MCPAMRGMWTPSNTRCLGPTRVLDPNGISIGSAVFAGLTSVTDRPTDHVMRSVTIGRIYVCSTLMWPNNFENCSASDEVMCKSRVSFFLLTVASGLVFVPCCPCWLFSYRWKRPSCFPPLFPTFPSARCTFVCSRNSKTARPNFTEFSVCVTCGRDLPM